MPRQKPPITRWITPHGQLTTTENAANGDVLHEYAYVRTIQVTRTVITETTDLTTGKLVTKHDSRETK